MKTLSLVVLLCAATAHAGVILTTERKTQKGAQPTAVYIEGSKLRTDARLEDGSLGAMIFDGDAKKLITVDGKEKKYTELNEADIKMLGEQMAAARAQMEKQMAGMPPEQRKQMEAMMGPMGGGAKGPKPARTFQATPQKRQVKSWRCLVYKVMQGGVAVEETCVAPWQKVGVTMEDFKGLEALTEFVRALGGPMASDDSLQDFAKYPGFPVSRAGLAPDGSKMWEEELVSVKRESLSADKFAPPPGYTKVKPPAMGAR